MKLLVATLTGQGDHPKDFDDGITEGEVVEPAMGCWTTDEPDEDGCTCARSFFGLTSHKCVTTAIVTELPDVDLAVLLGILADRYPDEVFEDRLDKAKELIEYAVDYDEGTVCRIWAYRLWTITE